MERKEKGAHVSGTDANALKYVMNDSQSTAKVISAYLVPHVSVATHASNYITTTIAANGATIASHTTNSTGGSAMTAGTPIALTLSGDTNVASRAVVTVTVTKSGTGPAYSFDADLEFEPVR